MANINKRTLAVAALYDSVLAGKGEGESDKNESPLELADEVRALEFLARRIRARIEPDWLALPLELLAMIVSQRHCDERARRFFRRTCRTLRVAVDLNFTRCQLKSFHLRKLVVADTSCSLLLRHLQTISVAQHANSVPLSLPDLLDGRLPALRNLCVSSFSFPLKYDQFSTLQPLNELRLAETPWPAGKCNHANLAQLLAQLMRLSVGRLVYAHSNRGRDIFGLDIFCKTVGRIRRASPMRSVERVALLLTLGAPGTRYSTAHAPADCGWTARPIIFGVFDELMVVDRTCSDANYMPTNCADCIDARLYCLSTFAPRLYIAGHNNSFARWGRVIAANPDHVFGRYKITCVAQRITYTPTLRRKYYPQSLWSHVPPHETASKALDIAVTHATAFVTQKSTTKPIATFTPLCIDLPYGAHVFQFPTLLPLVRGK